MLKDDDEELTTTTITNFLLSEIPSTVVNLRLTTQATEFITTTTTKTNFGIGIILFTDKFDPSIIMKSIAYYNNNDIAVAEVRGNNNNLLEEFELTNSKLPVVIVVCSGSDKLAYEIFEKEIKNYKEIQSFINKFKNNNNNNKNNKNKNNNNNN